MGSTTVFTGVLVFLILTQLQASSAAREKRQLSCNHPIRIVRPDLFAHCSTCNYTPWGSWRVVNNSVVTVPEASCPSEKAYTEERNRTLATGIGCTSLLRETRRICLPTQEERLIIGLGLGGSGNNFNSLNNVQVIQESISQTYSIGLPPLVGPPDPPTPPTTPGITKRLAPVILSQCPRHGTNGRICSSLPGIGKRSIKNYKAKTFPLPKKNKIVHSDINPIPFDWLEHGPRLRNKRQTTCGDQSVQHVLFVIDTSGSIGQAQFDRVKTSLALLPTLFCKQVKFAAITFSSYVNLEFCFDCYENTHYGRSQVSAALTSMVFRSGQTHTGATARCVCQEILHPSCGIGTNPECLDVVFITDGQSNDPTLQICDEVRCLHSRDRVDTYAIGINSAPGYGQTYNINELNCIAHNSDLTSAFEFESFDAFETAINNIFTRLINAPPNSPESCARLDGSISPTGAALGK